MSHVWKHPARRFISLQIDKIPHGIYGKYRLDKSEFIGTINEDIETIIDIISDTSYSYIFFAATKLHPETGKTDEGSYRRVDPEDKNKQWHIHFWTKRDNKSKVEVYSHYEYTPILPFNLKRTMEHYKPEYGKTYICGQHCEVIKEVIEKYGEYKADRSKLGSTKLDSEYSVFDSI